MLKVTNSNVKGLYVRGRAYYARLTIPNNLHSVLEKSEFVCSLGTTDLIRAEARAELQLRDWRSQIATAKGGVCPNQEALLWKAELENAKGVTSDGQGGFDYDPIHDAYNSHLEHLEDTKGFSHASKFNQLVTGKVLPTERFITKFMTTRTVLPKSLQQEETRLRIMAKKFPILPVKQRDVNRWWIELTQEYVTKYGKPYSPKTAGFIMNISSTFYRYLIDQGHLDEDMPNPFKDVTKYDGGGKKNKPDTSYLPWLVKDVERLITTIHDKPDKDLLQFVILGAHIGARANEIAMLKVADINITASIPYFSITDSKTKAGIREIPIHSYILPLFTKLVRESSNEYLLPDLTITGTGSRASAIGKRFGRVKAALGYGGRHVYHSFRGTVVHLTLITDKNALSIAQDIVGHEKGNVTEDIYNALGSSMEQRSQLLEDSIRYPFQSTPALELLKL